MVSIPIPIPKFVGQLVPDCGRAGGVPVGAGVPAQTQFWLVTQEAFLQKP